MGKPRGGFWLSVRLDPGGSGLFEFAGIQRPIVVVKARADDQLFSLGGMLVGSADSLDSDTVMARFLDDRLGVIIGGTDQQHAAAAVEGTVGLVVGEAQALEVPRKPLTLKQDQGRVGHGIESCADSLGQQFAEFTPDAAAGDVGDAGDAGQRLTRTAVVIPADQAADRPAVTRRGDRQLADEGHCCGV